MGVDEQQTNSSEPDPRKNSAAKRRADQLSEKLGIDLWAKYPAELMEFRMDRPPTNALKRQNWKPIHGPKIRVYSTYMRYSWCWPICLEYAVVTDDRDEILRDHKGRPLVLTQDRVSEMLGMSKQRVASVVLDLIADKLIRTAVVPGRQHSMAVYLEGKPTLTEEERRDKSTVVTTGLEGPRLEPAVLRRFSTLLNQLGSDDDLITVPVNGNPDGAKHQVRAADYRTVVWKRIIDNRTAFLRTLKTARYSERKDYSDTATLVRNLIDQRESPEEVHSAAAASVLSPAAAAAGAPSDAPGSASPPPHPSHEEALSDYQPVIGIIEAFRPLGVITESKCRRLLKDCGGATALEISTKAAKEVPGILAQVRRGAVSNPVGLLIHKLEQFFHSPAQVDQWRRECEEEAIQQAAAERRAEERRQQEEKRAAELRAKYGEDWDV